MRKFHDPILIVSMALIVVGAILMFVVSETYHLTAITIVFGGIGLGLGRLSVRRPSSVSAEFDDTDLMVTRLAGLREVWDMADEVWGDKKAARRFMLEEHPLLDGRRPADAVVNGDGPLVKNILGRLRNSSAV